MFRTDFIDLHCDTITGFKDIDAPDAAFAISKIPQNSLWTQFCAIFVPDNKRGKEAVDYYERHRDIFYSECEKHSDRVMRCVTCSDVEKALRCGKHPLILTVEGGAVLNGDIDRVKKLRDDGVRALTLVWNGENELGSGHSNPEKGLTPFGKEAVSALEEAGIIIDVSHLNDKGFHDLCAMAKKPFIATHSNSRTVTAHKRNLPDDFVCEIVSRGGLIGLNYYIEFLRTSAGEVTPDDIYRHVEHLLSLGAQNVLALGSDFDGAELPGFLKDAGDVPAMCEYLISRGINENTVRAMAFSNAMRFFRAYL